MTTRDERLLALRTAVEEWAQREEDRLNAEKRFLESLPTASGDLSESTTEAASALVQHEIDEFLVQ